MADYTPGPWGYWGACIYAPGEDGTNICAISEPHASQFVEYTPLRVGSKDRGEAFANARLIAAAPDLLEAAKQLVALLQVYDRSKYQAAAVKRLDAAIAKAEGREDHHA